MSVIKSSYSSESFTFDFKFECNEETLASLCCSDSFFLPNDDNKLAIFSNMYGDFCILHQKPIPVTAEIRLQLICGLDTKNIDITIRNEVFHSEKLEYKMFSGNDNVFESGDIPDQWKNVDGMYHLRLILSYPKDDSSERLERFKKAFEDGLGADLTIKLEDGKELKVSKFVLMTQSDFFRALIEGKTEILIKDVSLDVMQQVMLFLYSGTLDLKDMSFALSVLEAAEKFGLEKLVRKCESFVVENEIKDEEIFIVD